MPVPKTERKGFIIMFLVLLIFWLLLSNSFDWQHLLTGALLSFILAYFSGVMAIRTHNRPVRITFKQALLLCYYLLCLLVEIFKANIKVAAMVLNPKLPISPGLVIMKNELKKDLPRVFYANSITLTPGTITVDLEGDLIIVHAFCRETATGVQGWYMYELMKDIEGEQ